MSKKQPTEKEAKCHILVPMIFAIGFDLDQAINIAMEHTLITNNEIFFFYNPETKWITSPILEGNCSGLELPMSLLREKYESGEAIATFHTHSSSELEIQQLIAEEEEIIPQLSESKRQEYRKFLEEGIKKIREVAERCDFSTDDLHSNFITYPFKEIKLGCPFIKEITTMQYDPKLNKILFDIATLDAKSGCTLDMNKSINAWANKLDELLPQFKEQIEASRYEFFKNGLPIIREEEVEELERQLIDKIHNYPQKREKWKKSE